MASKTEAVNHAIAEDLSANGRCSRPSLVLHVVAGVLRGLANRFSLKNGFEFGLPVLVSSLLFLFPLLECFHSFRCQQAQELRQFVRIRQTLRSFGGSGGVQ